MKYKKYLAIATLVLCVSCRRKAPPTTAFYYWSVNFQLKGNQADLLQRAALNRIYIRFFDVRWNDRRHQAYPEAIAQFKQPVKQLHITPVIYIANRTFENIRDSAIVSLAAHCNMLVSHMATEQQVNYEQIQLDCDWSLTTRDKYFTFLKAFKRLNHHSLQATIRLHQVKYKERTGIPPVDRGILMFYNMGKLNADLRQPNSIYNETDARKYTGSLNAYPLPLDIALPVFSWSIQVRKRKVIQVYGKLGPAQLNNRNNFESVIGGRLYRAKRSFFLAGIYVKENDMFKLEEMYAGTLNTAVKQLIENLPKQSNRTIIYYELANINLSEFKTETIKEISDLF